MVSRAERYSVTGGQLATLTHLMQYALRQCRVLQWRSSRFSSKHCKQKDFPESSWSIFSFECLLCASCCISSGVCPIVRAAYAGQCPIECILPSVLCAALVAPLQSAPEPVVSPTNHATTTTLHRRRRYRPGKRMRAAQASSPPRQRIPDVVRMDVLPPRRRLRHSLPPLPSPHPPRERRPPSTGATSPIFPANGRFHTLHTSHVTMNH